MSQKGRTLLTHFWYVHSHFAFNVWEVYSPGSKQSRCFFDVISDNELKCDDADSNYKVSDPIHLRRTCKGMRKCEIQNGSQGFLQSKYTQILS